jgi:O-antigen/teichoic acid export membrane protein
MRIGIKHPRDSVKDHFKNASWSSVATGLRAFIGLANALFAVRLVGVDGYGHLVTVLSIFVIYVSLNTNLYTVLVVRLASQSYADSQSQRSDILGAAILLTALTIAILVAATCLTYWISPGFIRFGNISKDSTFLLMGVLGTIQILTALQGALVEAGGRLDLTMKSQLAGPIAILITLSLMAVLDRSLSQNEYLQLLCGAALVDFCIISIIRRISVHLSMWQRIGPKTVPQLKTLFRASGALQTTALMNLFLDPLNRILLGYFSDAASVTTYDLAMKVIWGIQSLFTSAMRVFLHFAGISEIEINKAYIRVISLIAVPALILHTAGAIFLYCIAHWWLSIEVRPLILFYALATVSNLGMIFVTPLYTRLINIQDLTFIVKSQVILALTNSTLSLCAIPFFGLLGAAIGLLIATIYNIPAIYFRYENRVAPINGMKTISNLLIARISLAALLFVISVSLGVVDRMTIAVIVLLVIGMITLSVTEPLTRRLMSTLLQSVGSK